MCGQSTHVKHQEAAFGGDVHGIGRHGRRVNSVFVLGMSSLLQVEDAPPRSRVVLRSRWSLIVRQVPWLYIEHPSVPPRVGVNGLRLLRCLTSFDTPCRW